MTDAAPQPPSQHAPQPGPTSPPPIPDASTPEQLRALLLAIILVFAIAVGAGWALLDGVLSGAARWPVRPSMHRVVDRASEPAMFHAALGVYAAIGIVSLSLGVWGMRQWLSLRVGRQSSNR